MALVECPECSHSISDKAQSCPQCGFPISEKLVSAPSEPTLPETVECLDCEKTFPFKDEVCPNCGLFNSQKYKIIELEEAKPQADQIEHVSPRHRQPKAGKWLSCPRCAGEATGGRGCLHIAAIILLFPVGLLFLLIKPTYTCNRCGYRFKS